ncbi:HET-domain-containing protein [Apiospora saccharicola]|uniref:HET-domain-containing protein n=1 Tax=Apiospora saccharicola TaxID=335842 RepID=A0ABR1V0R4_9PEZI
METLQQSVEVGSLPRVFQDAITIARRLGIYYLWIDSLCIKQDEDLRDWKVESESMGRIYASACLNISATWSINVGDNLLDKRTCVPKVASPIEIDMGGLTHTYYALDGFIWSDEVDYGPLNDRGWVFQERYLARRVVHFGQSQMAWECKEGRALEMFPDELPILLGRHPKFECAGATIPITSQPSQSTVLEFAQGWQNLLKDYCRCELSFPRDKLMALKGISTHVAMKRPGDSYLAGSWTSTILFDLPWHRHENDRKEYPIANTYERAPSWSWASVDGAVQFPFAQKPYSNILERYAEVKSLTGQDIAIADRFATTGTIRLEASCMPLHLQLSEENDITGIYGPGFQFSTTKGPFRPAVYFECTNEVLYSLSRAGKLFLIPLFATSHSIYGIIVQKVRGVGEHRRVGAVCIDLMTITGDLQESGGNSDVMERDLEYGSSHMDNVSEKWSISAIKFSHHFTQQPPGSRCINIS